MLAYIVAFLTPMIYAVSNILEAQFSTVVFKKNVSTLFYCGITNILSIPFLLFIGGAETLHFPLELVPIVFLTAVLDLLCLYPYYESLKRADTSVVAALWIPAQVFLPFLSYLIVNEQLAFWQYIGFFLTLAAASILNLKWGDKIKINLAFYLMLFAALMFVLEQVVSKKALLGMPWFSFAFYWCICTDILLFSFLLFPSVRKDITSEFASYKKHVSYFILLEVVDRTASMCYTYSLAFLPVVVRASINATQPIFVLLYGVILYHIFGNRFKETLTRQEVIKKLICFTIIILGVALASK